jgi:hypothetical protein
MQKLNKKQLLNHRVNTLALGILNTLTNDEVTLEQAERTLPKSTSYKDHDTGEIRTGFSWKGLKKLVKKHPYVDVASAKLYFGLS